MCSLFFLKIERDFYQKILNKLITKNKYSSDTRYYMRKVNKLNNKIDKLENCKGDVIFFKSIDDYEPYFL